jgi:hypothetical protein
MALTDPGQRTLTTAYEPPPIPIQVYPAGRHCQERLGQKASRYKYRTSVRPPSDRACYVPVPLPPPVPL